jgi:predicted short-subunit dehydrogenase-like oxidoreductase (DUF2520 family)
MKRLNFIGCGAVGQVLGRLFHDAGIFEIGEILNRSPESGRAAAAFIGAGRPVAALREMRPADVIVIAASDNSIPDCAEALASTDLVGPETIVCHLSGALSSEVLAPLREAGGAVASVHPVKSFAESEASAASFPGTWCGIEGDPRAVADLTQAFQAIGGKVFSVDTRFKGIYHAGAVFACNYLTALVEVALNCYEKAGLPRETALQVMEPLLRGTVDNIYAVGTDQALTGPIARGDASVVSRQLALLDAWDGEKALLYRDLGRVALDLSRRAGKASEENLALLESLLAESD